MDRTVEEITTALEVIRDVCKNFERDCEHCPLRVPAGKFTKASCGIENAYPRVWKIQKPEDWVALNYNSIY